MLAFAWMLLIAVLIVVLGFVAGGWLAGVASIRLSRSGMDPLARELVASLIKPVIVIIALVAALQQLGVNLTSVTAILGAATLAIGLSLRDSLANVAAGAVLLTLRPFTAGDLVDAGGETGTIMMLTLFMTRIKTPQGAIINVPNNNIIKASIRNYTRAGTRRIDVDLDIESGQAQAAMDLLPGAIRDIEGVLAEPGVGTAVVDVVPGGVRVKCFAWTEAATFGPTKARVMVAVDVALNEAGITRVSPLRRLLEAK